MANQFLALVAPANNGAGTAVDFSSFGASKTISVTGAWTLPPTVTIEMNNDPAQAGSWAAICPSFQGAGEVTVNVACRWLRATMQNYRGGQAPIINIGGSDDGTSFATLVAPSGDGSGAGVDVSALGLFKTIQVGGAFRGSTVVELSEDGGVTWSQQAAFQAPGIQTAEFTADFLRVSRNGVPVNTPGLPIVNVAACDVAGGGGGSSILSDFTPPALPAGTTNDYAPVGIASFDRIRQATNVASSALSGLAALPSGTVRYLENLGPGALTILNQSALSSAGARFVTPNGEDLVVPPGGDVTVVYDATSSRWYAIAVVQAKPDINVRDYGATGDGVTDDRVAFIAAVAAAIAAGSGAKLVLPPGTYRLSKYLDIAYARSLTIAGEGNATILYPSDDTTIPLDSIATTDAQARSGFFLRYCTNTIITGITFKGGTAQEISTVNVGNGIYATSCVNTLISACNGRDGAALYVQDAAGDSTGIGDSLAVALGIVTLTDAAGLFNPGMVGRPITIAGATDARNNTQSTVLSYLSPTQITYAAPGAVAEVSAFSWTVNNHDQITRLVDCSSYGCRASSRTGQDGVYQNCTFEQPMNNDATGQGDAFTKVGTTMTLTDASAPFKPYHDKKYIRILGATSAANNVLAQLTYISATQVSFTNAAGVAELYTGRWWIQGGDKTGIGTSLTFAAGEVTLVASAPVFTADDVNKSIRITWATSDGNNGHFRIKQVVSSTTVKFNNASGVTEAYAQGWGLDAYDNVLDAGTYGSTHAIYIFAGRSNVLVDGCTFRGIRTVALKVSGSNAPIRGVTMRNCYLYECGSVFIGGADDAMEHSGLSVDGNTIIDCATGRPGWSENIAIQCLGARNVAFRNNQFHYTHNAITSVDDSVGSLAGVFAIQADRYIIGRSQPMEDVSILGNKLTADPNATTPAAVLAAAFNIQSVGIREIHGSDATVSAKVGNICTLTSASGLFSQQLVGCDLTLVFSAGGNDVGPVKILSVAPGGFSLTYTNAGGTAGFSAGTFRITAPGGKKAGACTIAQNTVLYVAATGLLSARCVTPTITDNEFAGCEVLAQFEGDTTPRFTNNRQVGRNSDTAGIRLNNRDGANDGFCVSWPVIGGNLTTNDAIGGARPWGVGIGVSSGTYVDFPLLGMRGRSLPTGGKEQVVVAYGSGLVDGDTLTVDDGTNPAVTYTYKAAGPGALQFNSVASLIALIAAQPNITCVDYGSAFKDSAGAAAPVTTYHLLISAAAATANTDGTLKVQASTLLQTALVVLPNTTSPNRICGGRGSGSAGPTADKTVIWSPLCSFEGTENIVADDSTAQTLLATSGFRSIRQATGIDGGSNTLISTGTTAGTNQFRWSIA